MKRLVMLLPLLLFASLMPQAAVRACSRYPLTLQQEVAGADVIVRARGVDYDDFRFSYIVQVETYLKGSGADFVLVSHGTPVSTLKSLSAIVGGGIDCDFRIPPPGVSVYLFLARQAGGNFQPVGLLPYLYFYEPTRTVELGEHGYVDDLVRREVNEQEYVALILDFADQEMLPPETDHPFPLTSPVLLTTSEGTRYLIPASLAPPIELTPELMYEAHISEMPTDMAIYAGCPYLDCMTFSSDWLHFVHQRDETIVTDGRIEIPGSGFQLSPSGTFLAVWQEATITIYRFITYEGLPGWTRDLEPITTIRLDHESGELNELVGRGAWSSDDRIFAYSDSQGLWLWDSGLMENREQQILVSANGQIPDARYFSPQGHYLAITIGEDNQTFDIANGEMLPDGLVSPDDRTLLAFDTQVPVSSLAICSLYSIAAVSCEEMHRTVSQVEWKDNYSFYAVSCRQDAEYCSVLQGLISSEPQWWRSDLATTYAYDPLNGTLVMVTDTRSIRVERRNTISYHGEGLPIETYDLSHYLDGDIVSVEWLPSYFYRAS